MMAISIECCLKHYHNGQRIEQQQLLVKIDRQSPIFDNNCGLNYEKRHNIYDYEGSLWFTQYSRPATIRCNGYFFLLIVLPFFTAVEWYGGNIMPFD